MCTNMPSPSYAPGTNTELQVNYTSKTNSEKEIRFVVMIGRSGRGNRMKIVKRYTLLVIKYVTTSDVMYNVINITNPAVSYI